MTALPSLPPYTRRLTPEEERYLATMADPQCNAGPYYDLWLQLPFRSIPLQNREARMIRDAVLAGLWADL